MSIKPPSLEEINARWQEAEQERLYWEEHYQEFLHRYPDQFVAVRDGRVVAVSDHLSGLTASLKELGLQPTDVWSHYFMTTTDLAL
jgi:hypothetical protein